MKHFWHGFQEKTAAPLQFKKHVVVLFWNPDDSESTPVKGAVKRLSMKYPSVKVKLINVKKEPTKPAKHNIVHLPAVVLLKDGREVERLDGDAGGVLLEQLFRKAHV